jgi:hypothetical protein
MASLTADTDDVRELTDITASILRKVVCKYTMKTAKLTRLIMIIKTKHTEKFHTVNVQHSQCS